MHDDYDFEKLAMLKDKYGQNCGKEIPLSEIFSLEEHLYLLKLIFEQLLREMGYTRTLTYDEVSYILENISGYFV